jgi:hypothetical protein
MAQSHARALPARAPTGALFSVTPGKNDSPRRSRGPRKAPDGTRGVTPWRAAGASEAANYDRERAARKSDSYGFRPIAGSTSAFAAPARALRHATR